MQIPDGVVFPSAMMSEEHLKKQYLKLAKVCHPDAAGTAVGISSDRSNRKGFKAFKRPTAGSRLKLRGTHSQRRTCSICINRGNGKRLRSTSGCTRMTQKLRSHLSGGRRLSSVLMTNSLMMSSLRPDISALSTNTHSTTLLHLKREASRAPSAPRPTLSRRRRRLAVRDLILMGGGSRCGIIPRCWRFSRTDGRGRRCWTTTMRSWYCKGGRQLTRLVPLCFWGSPSTSRCITTCRPRKSSRGRRS